MQEANASVSPQLLLVKLGLGQHIEQLGELGPDAGRALSRLAAGDIDRIVVVQGDESLQVSDHQCVPEPLRDIRGR